MFESLFDFRKVSKRLPLARVFVVICLCACQAGCVYRRMMIRTNPPGAVVYVDDYEIGTTPISTDFTYYGTRKIRLVKDGCETLTVMQPVRAPWYQFPFVDFVSENLLPFKIRDQRSFTYNLMPQMVVPTDQLLSRADELRTRAGQGGTLDTASEISLPPMPQPEVYPQTPPPIIYPETPPPAYPQAPPSITYPQTSPPTYPQAPPSITNPTLAPLEGYQPPTQPGAGTRPIQPMPPSSAWPQNRPGH